MRNTIEMSVKVEDGVGETTVETYSMDPGEIGKPEYIKLCPGDLIKICNVLWDYEGTLREIKTIYPEIENTMMHEVYADQLNKIRGKIEKQIGYSVEEAHEKCIRKRAKPERDEGIGEEAMVLAYRKSAETRKEQDKETLAAPKKKKEKAKKEGPEPEKEKPDTIWWL